MPAIFHQVQRQHYRITLDITALGDFAPENIDWDKLFELDGNEHCERHTSRICPVPDSW